MNDKSKYDDKDMTEELGDEGFDSGKGLKGFSGEEDELDVLRLEPHSGTGEIRSPPQ
jgi:hypothetical protein